MATIKLKRKPITEDEEEIIIKPNRSSLDTSVEARDIISGLVGKGYTRSAPETNEAFQRLSVIYGKPQAQKIMEQMFIYNQNPQTHKLPTEQRISGFYDKGSLNADVNRILKENKGLGYGVLPGFRNSPFVLNQELQGLLPAIAGTGSSDELKKKGALLIEK